MENELKKELINNATRYGKKQIEDRMFSRPIANSNFKSMIDTYKITEKNDAELLKSLNEAFKQGQKISMQNIFKEALKVLPEKILEKYGDSINYDDKQDEFSNFYEMDYKLQLIKNIPIIEKNKSNIKVLVLWSESIVFRDNQVLSIKDFKQKCDRALIKLESELKKCGLSGGYDKTKYILIFDDGKGKAITTNAIRYDIGDYSDFEDYLNRGFTNENIPKLLKEYLEFEKSNNKNEEETI